MYLRYQLVWHHEWSLRCCIGLFDHYKFLPKVWNIWHYLWSEILGYRQKVWKKILGNSLPWFAGESLFSVWMHINEDRSFVGSRFRVGRWTIFFRTRLRSSARLWWVALVLLVLLVQLVWPTPPASQASLSGDKLVVSVWGSNGCFLTNFLILIF